MGGMPRIVWNIGPATALQNPIEVHCASPSEFISHFAQGLLNGSVFLPADGAPPAGAHRDLLVEIGFIGRTLHFKAEIEKTRTSSEARSTGDPAGAWLKISALEGRALAELQALIQQIKQGQAFDAARAQDPPTGEKLSVERQIRSMPATLKIMLALKAEKDERAALMKDPDPQIIPFILRNPRLTLDEVRHLASRTSLNHQHIMMIAANPTWLNDEMVKLNLARNPRLPDTLVESMLQSMNTQQLRIVAGAVSCSPKTKRIAHRILQSRGA